MKKTYGDLYQDTMNRLHILKTLGYNVKYVWEMDWKKFIANKTSTLVINKT